MKRQKRRRTDGDGDLSDASWTEEERPESAEQPVAQRQIRRPLASTAQDDQLLLENEILRDHRSHATGATQPRGHDGQVKQGEQEVLHAQDSVGQISGATQRRANPGFSERIANSRRTGAGARCRSGLRTNLASWPSNLVAYAISVGSIGILRCAISAIISLISRPSGSTESSQSIRARIAPLTETERSYASRRDSGNSLTAQDAPWQIASMPIRAASVQLVACK